MYLILLYLLIPFSLAGIGMWLSAHHSFPTVPPGKAARYSFCFITLYTLSLGLMSCLRYEALSAKVMDLGVWEHYLWSLLDQGFDQVIMHRLIYLLYLPIYALGGIHSLLIFQAFLIGISAWIVFRTSQRILQDDTATFLFTASYLLYFPTNYLALFDFHADHWIPLLFALIVWQELKEKSNQGFLLFCTLVLLIVKEVMPPILWLYFLSAYGRTHKKIYWHLSLLIGLSMVLGALCFPFYIEINPLANIVPKIFYIYCLMAPLGLLSLATPSWLSPILIPLLFVLFSSSPLYHSIGTQYATVFTIPVFFSAILALPKAAQFFIKSSSSTAIRRVSIAVFILSLYFHALLAPTPLSRQFWIQSLHSSYHWKNFVVTPRDRKVKQIIREQFINKNLSVSVQNGTYYSPLGRQNEMFLFPDRLMEVDRVIYDTSQSGEIYDGVDPILYRNTLKFLEKRFSIVEEYEGFFILAPSPNVVSP